MFLPSFQFRERREFCSLYVRTRTVVDVIEQLIVLQDFTQNQRSDPMVERVVVNAEKSAVHHSFPDCRYI
jgi:hypothetical protein